MKGYCPVTFATGPPGYESIVPGKPDLIAFYDGGHYAFATESRLVAFLRAPERYIRELPARLPPAPEPLRPDALPLVGYLEQRVGAQIASALTALAQRRPVFPRYTLGRTALVFLALVLKARNEHNAELARKRYGEALLAFTAHCGIEEAILSKFAQVGLPPAGWVCEDPDMDDLAARLSKAHQFNPDAATKL
eukprot:m51a1_g13424 putative adenylate kinase domain-containing protein 1 (193) ;mRNA; r:1723-2301